MLNLALCRMPIRITAGKWRGRLLKVPRGEIRPAQDRVRLAVFSSLADRVPNARTLDLFAGTGAYGLEALSRGAASASWVENDRRVLAVLRENVANLCGPGGDTAVVCADALRFLERGGGNAPYDLIFADPPYDQCGDWLKKILSVLNSRSILKSSGLLVVEQSVHTPAVTREGWQSIKRRVYGETQIDYIAANPKILL